MHLGCTPDTHLQSSERGDKDRNVNAHISATRKAARGEIGQGDFLDTQSV